jgi:hypothetical protein
MAYIFAGLIVLFGAAVSAVLLGTLLGSARYDPSTDGHHRAAEREERWYPLR